MGGVIIVRGFRTGVIRPTAAKPRYRNPSAPTFRGEGGRREGGKGWIVYLGLAKWSFVFFIFLPIFCHFPPSPHPHTRFPPPSPHPPEGFSSLDEKILCYILMALRLFFFSASQQWHDDLCFMPHRLGFLIGLWLQIGHTCTHSYTRSHVPRTGHDLIPIFACESLCVCAADKHWQRVGNAVNAKGTSIHFTSPSHRSFSWTLCHIWDFCVGEGCALCGWQGPGGWRERICTGEGEIGRGKQTWRC